MHTSIDKFGRIVIPKSIRDHLGLSPGSVLEIQESDHEILLKTLDEQPKLKMEKGILVFTGKSVGNLELELESIRSERLKDIGNF